MSKLKKRDISFIRVVFAGPFVPSQEGPGVDANQIATGPGKKEGN